jgi:invasion protein IalB
LRHGICCSKMSCSVVQETFSVNNRAKLLSVEFLKTDKGEAAVILVPQGVNLKAGVDVAVDGSAKMNFAYSHCLNNQCLATADMSAAQLSAFKKAK